jgi:pSer/pThr/pTyr-binding forkhead associated (FHA) protein
MSTRGAASRGVGAHTRSEVAWTGVRSLGWPTRARRPYRRVRGCARSHGMFPKAVISVAVASGAVTLSGVAQPSAQKIGPPPGWQAPAPQAPASSPAIAPPPVTTPPTPAPSVEPAVAQRAPAAGPAAEETVRVSRSRHFMILTWDDGTHTRVYVPTLIGRNPKPTAQERAVSIPDTTSSLSKTHARLDVTGQSPSIQDLHSTNGVHVQRGGERFPVSTETATALQPGDVLIFGLRSATVSVTL